MPGSTFSAALFLHLLAVVAAFSASTLLHSAMSGMRRAGNITELRAAAARTARIGPRMPLFALALFATGVMLTAGRWAWSTPWIVDGVAGLIVMQLNAAMVMRPRLVRLGALIAAAAGEAIEGDLAAGLRAPALWVASQVQTGMALGIMAMMVFRPGAGGSLAMLVAGAGLGALVGLPARSVALAGEALDPAGS